MALPTTLRPSMRPSATGTAVDSAVFVKARQPLPPLFTSLLGLCCLVAMDPALCLHANLCLRTYKVSSSILQLYYTHLVGDPTSMPTIKASAEMARPGGSTVIEADLYTFHGASYKSTNVFFRQIRNLIIDTTSVSGKTWAIHWPSAQATSIQNVVFQLSQTPDSDHTGIFMEEGSGGFLGDLVFYGGQWGAQFGNQQYTTRNLTFVNCQTAILQIWDWFWVYKDIIVRDCGIGINMTGAAVGSAVIMDSVFYNVSIAVAGGRSVNSSGETPGQGTFVMENVIFQNVESIFQGSNGSLLEAPGAYGTLVTGMVLVGILSSKSFWFLLTGEPTGKCVHPQWPSFCVLGAKRLVPRPFYSQGRQQVLHAVQAAV